MNPVIDRMRGIFAALVAFSHIFVFATFAGAKPDVVYGITAPFQPVLGFIWVVGFIVVSGYCVTLSTIVRPTSLLSYLALRASRIYPTLLTALLLALVVEIITHGSSNRSPDWNWNISLGGFLLTAVGAAGLNSNPFGSLAPSYTVSWELLYYVIWGVAIALLPSGRAALWSAATFGVCMLALANIISRPPVAAFTLMFFLIWLVGAAVAVYQNEIMKTFRCRAPLIWAGAALYMLVAWENELIPQYGTSHFSALIFYLLLGAFFASAVIAALSFDANESQIDRWLGEISYPLFLCHGPVIVMVAFCIRHFRWEPSFAVCTMLMIGMSVLVSQAVLVLVERPILRWRRSLRIATPAAAAIRPQIWCPCSGSTLSPEMPRPAVGSAAGSSSGTQRPSPSV